MSMTDASASTFEGPLHIKDGYPWVDVIAWGADPTGAAPSDAAIQAAVDYAGTQLVGAVIYIPQGFYLISKPVKAAPETNEVHFTGAGRYATTLFCGDNDITILDVSGRGCTVEHMNFVGKGAGNNNANPGSFGATQPTVRTSGALVMRDVIIVGGFNCLKLEAVDDCFFEQLVCNNAYGNAVIASGSPGSVGTGNWFFRCKIDQGYPNQKAGGSSYPNSKDPSVAFALWQPGQVYASGDTAVISNFLVQAVQVGQGTSGSTAPTLANYNVDMVDGSVTWNLCYPLDYCACLLETNSNSNAFSLCDFTGAYPYSVTIRDTLGNGMAPALTQFMGCTLGSAYDGALNLVAGDTCMVTNCVIGGNLSEVSVAVFMRDGWQGGLSITGSTIFKANYGVVVAGGPGTVLSGNTISGCSTYGISVNPDVTDFTITNNYMGSVVTLGNTNGIQVQAGNSDYYIISNNLLHGSVVNDRGAGMHKSVTGNV